MISGRRPSENSNRSHSKQHAAPVVGNSKKGPANGLSAWARPLGLLPSAQQAGPGAISEAGRSAPGRTPPERQQTSRRWPATDQQTTAPSGESWTATAEGGAAEKRNEIRAITATTAPEPNQRARGRMLHPDAAAGLNLKPTAPAARIPSRSWPPYTG